jgi:hypothetical protein
MASSVPEWDDFDGLYDQVGEGIDQEVFAARLEELVSVGMIQVATHNDELVYNCRPNLTWAEVCHIDCPIKKEILLIFIDNPTNFFILLNTQKGKMRLAALEVKSWAATGKKVAAFFIVDNDKSLADQSEEGIRSQVGEDGKVFLLSSNSATSFEEIETYLDAYATDVRGKYKMPIVVALPNDKQLGKVLRLMSYIKTETAMYYGVVFDEADKIYPAVRDKKIGGVSFGDLVVGENPSLHRLGFVTATEGVLLDEKYPECANAHMQSVGEGHPNYRAFHHADSTVHEVKHAVKDSNDKYATKVIGANTVHFTAPSTLPSGEVYYPKTIVNSSASVKSMHVFANSCVSKDAYAMTFNMSGVKVYRPGKETKTYSVKKRRFNELLFYIYKKLGLGDKPLYIIGRRKVDRGLAFHYAPRDTADVVIQGPDGPLTVTGGEGLIWTDMILGRVPDKATAVQKAGRGAGIIAGCPQYPGKFHYWTDKDTANMIRRHNSVVDEANDKTGCSALQAMTRAEADVPTVERAVHGAVNHMEEFASMEALRARWTAILAQAGQAKGHTPSTPRKKDDVYVCSIGGVSEKQDARDIATKFPEGGSVANWGSGITGAVVGEYVHRVYAGYEANGAVVFFLRWTIKV